MNNVYLCVGLVVVLIIILILIYNKKRNIFKYGYFDSNGTTMMNKKALESYKSSLRLGNASAEYASEARDMIEKAQELVMDRTNTNKEEYDIIFNSGASQGNNLIIRSIAMASHDLKGMLPHIILSSVEHKTSITCAQKLEKRGFIDLTLIQSDISGVINPLDVAQSIRPNTCLVSIMRANNETGAINDIKAIGKICKMSNVFFHSDCVQSFGKEKIPIPDWNLDAVTLSMHKIYGPQGVGIIILSKNITNTIDSSGSSIAGTQWNHLHGGTINSPGIAASCVAMTETFKERTAKNDNLKKNKLKFIKEMLKEFQLINYEVYAGKPDSFGINDAQINIDKSNIKQIGMVILGPTKRAMPDEEKTTPNCILFSLPRLYEHSINDRVCNVKIKQFLADRGFTISIGSACNTSSVEPSHVLKAIRAPFIIRSATLRVSMTDSTTPGEIKQLANLIKKAIKKQN